MDTSELMIEDLVMTPNFTKQMHVCRIVAINGYRPSASVFDIEDVDIYTVDAEDVEPIPLTKEILELNGFLQGKYPMQEAFEHKDVGSYNTLYVKIVEKGEDRGFEAWNINDDAYLVFICKYVHELQQALRVCKFNDIEEKFKVLPKEKAMED